MVAEVSGTVLVEMLGSTSTFVLVNGELTVDGVPKPLTPTDKKGFPIRAAWFQYAPDSFIQITPLGIEVKATVGTKVVQATVTKPSGTFMVKIEEKTSTFVLAEGKLTVEGTPVELKPSENDKYPATEGWIEYKTDSFIQISATVEAKASVSTATKAEASATIEVEVLVDEKKVKATVSEPKPVPEESKYWIKVLKLLKKCFKK